MFTFLLPDFGGGFGGGGFSAGGFSSPAGDKPRVSSQ